LPIFGNYGVPLELAPLIRIITKKVYQNGARLVDVIWNDDQIRLIRFQNVPGDSFEEFPEWRADAALKTLEEDEIQVQPGKRSIHVC
jgi:leucyl aminopeptidase (aminopeptidase T)